MVDTVVPPTGPTQFVIDAGYLSTVGSVAQINISGVANSLRSEITWAPDGSGDARTFLDVEWPGVLGTLVNQASGIPGGAGPTDFRPTVAIGPLSVGCVYFDTDLGLPIWWDGTDWVDAAGAVV